MTLQSALEDLKHTTLSAVSGLLARLRYLSSLRAADGSYRHWGLSRVHGEIAAQRAVEDAHRATVTGILRTPLERLVRDAQVSGEGAGTDAQTLVTELSDRLPEILPGQPSAGSGRHLSSVLHALLSLTKK
ncbi:MAG TPA: hypothetical protein VFA89_02050 [Terriglobales bacterium]|nr:hypothetical protein [Terriglobales bacterium]